MRDELVVRSTLRIFLAQSTSVNSQLRPNLSKVLYMASNNSAHTNISRLYVKLTGFCMYERDVASVHLR